MRSLATADLHLGSPIRSLATRNCALGASVLRSSEDVLTRIIDLAIAERVDVLAIAGDLFDTDVPDVRLVAKLRAELSRAAKAGVPSVFIRGNHDAAFDHDRLGSMGEGIYLLDRQRPTTTLGDVVFHGLSFDTSHVKGSVLPDYPAPDPVRANVGLMHTSLGGAAGHDPYAPCSEADLLAHGYDLWCLGHIHKPTSRIEEGKAWVMPGIPQPRHFGERHGGQIAFCTVAPGDVQVETHSIAQLFFVEAGVETGPDAHPDDQIREALRAAYRPGVDLAVRLRVATDHLTSEDVQSMAEVALEDLPGVFLDKIVLTSAMKSEAPSGDLARFMREEIGSDAFAMAKAQVLQEMRDALPRDLRDVLDNEDMLLEDAIADVLRRIRAVP